jgi:hypothetical protein
MFLFVSMIMLGLMLFNTGQTETAPDVVLQRDLLEIDTQANEIENN